MIGVTVAVLLGLLAISIPVAAVLGIVGLVLDQSYSILPLYLAIGEFSWAVSNDVILVAVPLYILLGEILLRSGIAERMYAAMMHWMSWLPGGLMHSNIGTCTLFSAVSGSSVATAATIGTVAMGEIEKHGYNERMFVGTIAAGGTLGILIPPSIMLVIMADLLSKSVGNLFVAAIFPGFMLAGSYMVYIFLLCRFKPSLAPPLPDDMGPQSTGELLLMVLKSFVPPVFLVFLVLGSILFGWAAPTEAAGVGAAGATLLALLNHKLTWKILKDVIERSALTNGMIFGIFIGASCFSYVFRNLGGDELVVGIVESFGLGSWGLLVLLMGIVFLLGFFFDWIEITLIVLPVFSPIIELLDFGDHLPKGDVVYWFAILMAVNLQTSFLTPPFGFALFYMKGVAPPEVRIQQIYKGIIPFVMLQLTGLGLVMTFPNIALWLPRVLLN